MEPQSSSSLREALNAIIEGKIVKRSWHELRYNDIDVSSLFIEELHHRGYHPVTVDDVAVEPGERVPAFHVDQGVAWFGWVFWEQFTSWRLRKLWGSVVKNEKGDWSVQIPASRPVVIYANPAMKIGMDIEHPPEF